MKKRASSASVEDQTAHAVVWQCSCCLPHAAHCQNCFTTGAIPRQEKCNDTEDEVACQDTPVSRIKQLIRVTLIKIVPHPEPIQYQEQGGHSIIYPRSNPTPGPREQSHDKRNVMTQKMKWRANTLRCQGSNSPSAGLYRNIFSQVHPLPGAGRTR